MTYYRNGADAAVKIHSQKQRRVKQKFNFSVIQCKLLEKITSNVTLVSRESQSIVSDSYASYYSIVNNI